MNTFTMEFIPTVSGSMALALALLVFVWHPVFALVLMREEDKRPGCELCGRRDSHWHRPDEVREHFGSRDPYVNRED